MTTHTYLSRGVALAMASLSVANAQIAEGDLLALYTTGISGQPCAGKGDAVVRIDKDSGGATVISGCDAATGALVGAGPVLDFHNDFGTPGVASDGASIWVTSSSSTVMKLFRIDPSTGDREIISQPISVPLRGGPLAIVPASSSLSAPLVPGWLLAVAALAVALYAKPLLRRGVRR